MGKSEIEIRQLAELEEFAGVVRLQREIWGFQDVELLPLRLFVVADKIGGQVLGAFDAGKMVAFCLCIPGLKPGGKQYFHSHMLGVLPPYRNTGLGRRLKLEQREYALARLVANLERVAKAARGHEQRALAPPLEEGIGRDRRSHLDRANGSGRN